MPIIGFLATTKLAYGTNRIRKGAAIWLLPHYVHWRLANALNGHMDAKEGTVPIIASVCNNDIRSRKLLRSYSEVVNYFLKKYSTDQAIAEYDAVILHYLQEAFMSPQQYADNVVA